MKRVKSKDPLQPGYTYLVDPSREYYSEFTPDFSPKLCLSLGIFGGAYFRGYPKFLWEFPHLDHKINQMAVDSENLLGVRASLPRIEWQKRGWMHDDDPRGWFQWYCRFDMGRRHDDDERQINRWIKFKERKLRLIGDSMDLSFQARTRQGLIHWGIASPGMIGYKE